MIDYSAALLHGVTCHFSNGRIVKDVTLTNTEGMSLEELAASDPTEYSVKDGELYFSTRLWHEDLQPIGDLHMYIDRN